VAIGFAELLSGEGSPADRGLAIAA
jgi:hypothetical protein